MKGAKFGCRPVLVDGVRYGTGKAAAEALGIKQGKLVYSIQNRHKVHGHVVAYEDEVLAAMAPQRHEGAPLIREPKVHGLGVAR